VPKVIADITMSPVADMTGPGADEQHGLGDALELHTWVTERVAVDTEILEGPTAQSGAVVHGAAAARRRRRPQSWNEDMGYGADQTGTPGTRQMYRQRDIRPSKNAVHLAYERV